MFFYCRERLTVRLNKETKPLLTLHDPHDLVEENPVGQPRVLLSSALENRVHLHVLAVELDAALSLHHVLKQHNLQDTREEEGDCSVFAVKSLKSEVDKDHKGGNGSRK